jgi:hypothetical protein
MSSPPKGGLSRSSHSLYRPQRNGLQGMTLLELTVVILVLTSLIGLLFFGARAWKRGSDRAICIIHIHSVQKGIRSYSNLYDLAPGDIVPELKKEIIGSGKFMEITPTCPANGIYTYGRVTGIDKIPPIGQLYLECALSGPEAHEPPSHADW